MDINITKDYFAEAWKALNAALEGTGYVLNNLHEEAPDMFGEQNLIARFHRSIDTVIK